MSIETSEQGFGKIYQEANIQKGVHKMEKVIKRNMVLLIVAISCIVFSVGFTIGNKIGEDDGYQKGYLMGSNYGIFYDNIVGQRPNIYWELKHMNDSMDDYTDAVWEEKIRVKLGVPYLENCTFYSNDEHSQVILPIGYSCKQSHLK